MTIEIDPKNQMLGIWAGAIFFACFGVGLALIAPFVPPPAPTLSPEAVKALFVENAWRIKLGCFVAMMGAGFQVPLYVTLMGQMARMEKGLPILGITQLAIGAFNCSFFILGPVIWVTVAFRPDISPEIARSFNDFGWITYFFIVSPAIVANIVIAIAVFRDFNTPPILPRWFAYLNLWVAVIFIPAGFMPFFKSGPFAWNGFIVFWVVLSAFSVWLIALIIVLIKAVATQLAMDAARTTLARSERAGM